MRKSGRVNDLRDQQLRDAELRAFAPMIGFPHLVPAAPVLDRDELVWTSTQELVPLTARNQSSNLLAQFLALAGKPPEAIQRFASQWGMLNTAALGSLEQHLNQPDLWPRAGMTINLIARGWPNGEWRESIGLWRDSVEGFAAVLEIAGELREGNLGARATWDTLYPAFRDSDLVWAVLEAPKSEAGLAAIQIALAWRRVRDFLDRITAEASVRPTLLLLKNGQPAEALVGAGLSGALAIQLLHAVCRTHGPVTCSSCGVLFVPSRKPKPGNRAYCPSCRSSGAPQRDATRALAIRRKEGSATPKG